MLHITYSQKMLMHKRSTFISLVSAVLLTCQAANAQWQWMPDVCGGYAETADCRRDSNGNMHHNGNVYDPNGNPIRRNNNDITKRRSPNTNSSRSRFTPDQILQMADNFKQRINRSPDGELVQTRVCNGYGDKRLLDYGFSAYDLKMFKYRLGCR
jgi:hypothetical protein